MSFWSDFTDELSGVAKEVGRALIPGMAYKEGIANVAKTPVGKFIGKTVSGIGEGFSAGGLNIGNPNAGRTEGLVKFATGRAIQPIVATSGAQLTSQAQAAMTDITTNLAARKVKQYDPLLVIGEAAEKKVFSPYIKRPIAAAALATDPSSPLFDAGVYGEGFQFSDLQAAYNRTEDVSLGVALTKSYLNPWHLTGISDAILEDGGVDIDRVNLWDDKDVQKNFVDNVTGKYMSGITDALVGNAAIFAATAGAVKGAVAVGGKAGLSTTLKSITDFEARVNEDLIDGKQTVIGSQVRRMAASKDVNEIAVLLKKHTNNPRMINLIKNTESPELVRDFILADKGYAPALARIAEAKMSDDLWVLGDAATELQADFISTGKLRTHTYEQRERIAAAFDDAIAKNPKHQEIYDAFLQDRAVLEVTPELAARGIKVGDIDSVPRMSGKLYQPPEPILGSSIYAKVSGRITELKTANVTGDFSNVGGWTQQIIGRSEVPTVLLKIATSRMPRGMVTHSGLRPMDAIEEFNAHFDDSPLMRRGTREIRISQTESMSVTQYRTQFTSDYLSAGSDSARGLIIDRLNETLIRDIGRTYGLRKQDIDDLVKDTVDVVRGFHDNLANKSYAMDSAGVRYISQPQTQPMLRNSTALVNIGAIERDIIRAQNNWKKGARAGIRATDFIYEAGNRAFSFTQLVRPAYITKNSIIEPALVSILSQGSRAMTAEFSSGVKNAYENSKTRALRAIDATQNLTSPAKRALAKDFNLLSKEYSDAKELLDEHVAEYIGFFEDGTARSTQTKIEYADIVKRDLAAAEKFLRNIEEKLNDAAPEFTREVLKQPSLYNLTRRVKYLEGIVNQTSKSAVKKELFPGLAEYKDGGSGGLVGSRSTVGFVKVSALKDMNGNVPGNLEALASYKKSLREGKGFATREFEGKPFQDPIMVVYDNETGLAYVGEGNHRLQAAIDMGIPYVPVRVVRGYKSEMVPDIEKGKFLKQIKNNKEPEFLETVGSSAGKPVGPGYVPPEMHPSYVFDKKFIVEKDEFAAPNPEALAMASEIANAKSVINKAAGSIETLAPNLKAIEVDIAKAYASMESNIQDFGKLHADKADLFIISDGRTINYGSQKPFTAVMENGEKITGIPQYGDKNFLGDGYLAEVANTHTRQIELTGDKLFAQKVNIFNRRGPKGITDISSPHYFDELAFVVNTYMRGDVLVDKILAGATRSELLVWGKTRQARSYAYEFGKTQSDIVSIIDNQISYINRYLPSAEAQRIAGLGEVNSKSLAKILASEPQALTPIQPLEVAYSVKSVGAQSFVDTIDQLIAKAWTTLAKPENMFRYAWASTEYKSIMTDKLKSLYAMGYDVDATVINGIRTSAATEVVQNLEKTFYSIRRANRALFMARTVAAFPTAAASGIYRYSRLAIKNPARFGGFLNSYYGLYNSFGVDKYGNPVENVFDAEYLVVPGTKEMTNRYGGQGLKFPIRATTFAVNFAGPSWIVPIPMGILYSAKKGSDKEVKQLIDNTIGKIPGYSYDELFPYGVETDVWANVQRAVTPGWLPALRKYLLPNGDGTVDWMNSVSSEFKYQQILYDADLGPKPTTESVVKQVKRNFFEKFKWQFGSIIGTPAYVETKPGNIFTDLFTAKANSYVAEGKSRTEAADLAEQDVNQMLRLPKGTLGKDVLKLKSTSKSIYAPSSPETVSRIWINHKDLAKELNNLDKGGSLISLMTADIPYGTDSQASKFLGNPDTALPGGGLLNNPVKTVEQMQRDLEVSRYWEAYTNLKEKYNDAAVKAGYASYRSIPELVDALKVYGSTLGKASKQWNAAYKKSLSGDNAVVQAIGMQTVLNNKSYMDEFGSTQFWQHAKAFVKYRDNYAKLYADVPSGSKGQVTDAWISYLERTRADWDPVLGNIIDKYFLNDNLRQTNVETKKSKENK